MANISLQGGNKWTAGSVFDVATQKEQSALNAVTARVDGFQVAANNGKLLGIVNGQLAAVSLETWTGGSY